MDLLGGRASGSPSLRCRPPRCRSLPGARRRAPVGLRPGLRVGLEAYTYGLPLLVTNATFRTMTSVNVTNGQGFGPVNQFNSVRTLNNPDSTAVVAPGASSLSSIAWLDLSDGAAGAARARGQGPLLRARAARPVHREPAQPGQRPLDTPPGDYVIAPPGQHGVTTPAGHRADRRRLQRASGSSGPPSSRAPATSQHVNAIQDGYTLTPLSKYGTDYTPPAPATTDTTVTTRTPCPPGCAFFDTLGQQLATVPAAGGRHARARDLRHQSASAREGHRRRTPSLSPDTVRGPHRRRSPRARPRSRPTPSRCPRPSVHEARRLPPGRVRHATAPTTPSCAPWSRTIGLGAFTSDQTIYAMTLERRRRQGASTARRRYVAAPARRRRPHERAGRSRCTP